MRKGQTMKKLELDEVEPFFRWLAGHYKQCIPEAATSWVAEEPARQQEMVAEFQPTLQPVQQELPLGE